jgi:ABC-2 type transport system permease protein
VIRLYWEIGKRAFQRQLAYRTANLAGLVTNSFFGYIRAAILLAAFAGRGTIGGYDAAQVVTFTWVTQAIIMVVNLWGGLGLGETIRTGAVVSDLSKPFSYTGYWLARDYGRAAYYLLFRCIPILFVGQLTFGIRWPASPGTWGLVLLSICLATGICFAWNFMLELTGFWTVQTRGIRQLALGVLMFLSGFIVPIPLFPEWLQRVALALPFASISQVPCDVFLERLNGGDLAVAIAGQLAWAAVMLGAAQWLVTVATRRVITQGG